MVATRIIPLLTIMLTADHPLAALFKESHKILRENE